MIHKTKDLSVDQKIVIEGLLGRPISEEEAISIRAVSGNSVPEWLHSSWESASRADVDEISMEEIDLEIAAARSERRSRRQTLAQ